MFAYNDLPAIGALQYCQDHGIAVPRDVAVAGFDNLAAADAPGAEADTKNHESAN